MSHTLNHEMYNIMYKRSKLLNTPVSFLSGVLAVIAFIYIYIYISIYTLVEATSTPPLKSTVNKTALNKPVRASIIKVTNIALELEMT